jgi:hypothetical protein
VKYSNKTQNKQSVNCEGLKTFDVHGSVHLGKIYVRLNVQLDAHYMYSLFLYIFALHVSAAICTHPQEQKLQSTAIGVCNGYGMLIHWSRHWLGLTILARSPDCAKSVRVSQPVPAPMD